MYFLSSCSVLLIFLLLWLSFPSSLGSMGIHLSIIFMLCCLSASVYSTLSAGWASNSKYVMLGSLLTEVQTISYDVSFAIITLSLVTSSSSFNTYSFLSNFTFPILSISPILVVLWLTSAMAETNRAPFDFSEGESELVSGFNTVYAASGFVLFFLAEYSSILLMSFMFSVIFINPDDLNALLAFWTLFLAYMFIWVQTTLPRLRYDKLMVLAWKIFLPVSISALLFLFALKVT